MGEKNVLIDQGNELLLKIHQADIFNCSSLEDIIFDEDAEKFERWRLSVKSYLFVKPLFDEFQNLDWIVNGNRVSVEQVKKIIELLKIN